MSLGEHQKKRQKKITKSRNKYKNIDDIILTRTNSETITNCSISLLKIKTNKNSNKDKQSSIMPKKSDTNGDKFYGLFNKEES